MRRLSLFAAVLAPLQAGAHGTGHAEHLWSFDPWVWIPILTVVILYVRGLIRMRRHAHMMPTPGRIAAFASGMGALFLAGIWPLDVLSGVSSAAHMSQHMLLIGVAPPLLVLANSRPLLIAGLPGYLRRLHRRAGWIYTAGSCFARPGTAFLVHAIIVWGWHAPVPYEMALLDDRLHIAEHFTFLGSALLFWASLRRACRADGRGYGVAILWILATLMHTGLLGALLFFSPRVLYDYYLALEEPLMEPLEDQQLAGLIMWVPGGLCYLAAGLAYAAAWFRLAAQGHRGESTHAA